MSLDSSSIIKALKIQEYQMPYAISYNYWANSAWGYIKNLHYITLDDTEIAIGLEAAKWRNSKQSLSMNAAIG